MVWQDLFCLDVPIMVDWVLRMICLCIVCHLHYFSAHGSKYSIGKRSRYLQWLLGFLFTVHTDPVYHSPEWILKNYIITTKKQQFDYLFLFVSIVSLWWWLLFSERPMTFSGRSYAKWTLGHPTQKRMSLSLRFRTRQTSAILMYAKGQVDYSILAVSSWFVYIYICDIC